MTARALVSIFLLIACSHSFAAETSACTTAEWVVDGDPVPGRSFTDLDAAYAVLQTLGPDYDLLVFDEETVSADKSTCTRDYEVESVGSSEFDEGWLPEDTGCPGEGDPCVSQGAAGDAIVQYKLNIHPNCVVNTYIVGWQQWGEWTGGASSDYPGFNALRLHEAWDANTLVCGDGPFGVIVDHALVALCTPPRYLDSSADLAPTWEVEGWPFPCAHALTGEIVGTQPPTVGQDCDADTADPCNVITGEVIETEVDFTSSTLEFKRFYHSLEQNRTFTDLGPGWSHNYSSRIVNPDSTGPTIHVFETKDRKSVV